MIRIECQCRICATNAAKLGLPLPLAALVPDKLANRCDTRKGRHGLVHVAHDPNCITGQAVRDRTGIRAA